MPMTVTTTIAAAAAAWPTALTATRAPLDQTACIDGLWASHWQRGSSRQRRPRQVAPLLASPEGHGGRSSATQQPPV
ncbi:hypothetical protein BM1_07249 [Bipolaris maydis]|nr:hypothetical protein BM1_07249 [Bipolaris maydis]